MHTVKKSVIVMSTVWSFFALSIAIAQPSSSDQPKASENNQSPPKSQGVEANSHFETKAGTFPQIDKTIDDFLKTNQVPGCAVIVTARYGSLIYCRGFGLADKQKLTRFTPATLCAIASVSKSVTAAAIVKMIEAGKLNLNQSAFQLLIDKKILSMKDIKDSKYLSISIADLLHHESGFSGLNDLFSTLSLRKQLHALTPLTSVDLMKRCIQKPLNASPGEKYEYCNTNYLILDVIIEALTGKPYDQVVKETVFQPLGITSAKLFSSRMSDQGGNEATCYDLPDRSMPSVFPEDHEKEVPVSYGGIDYRSLKIWSMSTVDLAKFTLAMSGEYQNPVFTDSFRRILYHVPKHSLGLDTAGQPANWYYGLGCWVNWPGQIGIGHPYLSHTGNASGSFAGFKGRADGVYIIVCGNANNSSYRLADDLIDNINKRINQLEGQN